MSSRSAVWWSARAGQNLGRLAVAARAADAGQPRRFSADAQPGQQAAAAERVGRQADRSVGPLHAAPRSQSSRAAPGAGPSCSAAASSRRWSQWPAGLELLLGNGFVIWPTAQRPSKRRFARLDQISSSRLVHRLDPPGSTPLSPSLLSHSICSLSFSPTLSLAAPALSSCISPECTSSSLKLLSLNREQRVAHRRLQTWRPGSGRHQEHPPAFRCRLFSGRVGQAFGCAGCS